MEAKIVLNYVTSFLIYLFSLYCILGEGHLWKKRGHAADFVSNFQLLYTSAQFDELLLGYINVRDDNLYLQDFLSVFSLWQ